MNLYAAGWNIHDAFNLEQLICLILFFACLIGVCISIIALVLYKDILQTVYEAIDELKKISKNSVQLKIKRLETIMDNQDLKFKNNQIENALKIWKVEYYDLVSVKFIHEFEIILVTFANKKFQNPTFFNYRRVKKSYERIKDISNRLHSLFNQIDKVLTLEMIARDVRIQIRDVFNQFKKNVDIFIQEGNYKFDKEAFIANMNKVDLALEVVEAQIKIGNRPNAIIYQNRINEEILKLIKLVDAFYLSDRLLNQQIPDKIKQISKEIKRNSVSISQANIQQKKLVKVIDKYKRYSQIINHELDNLKRNSAFKYLSEINELVSNFSVHIQEEENTKEFLITNKIDLNSLFTLASTYKERIINLLEYNESIGIDINKYIVKFESIKKLVDSLVKEWVLIYKLIDNIENNEIEINLDELKDRLIILIKNLKHVFVVFSDIAVGLKPKDYFQKDLENKIIQIKATLSSSEALCTKNSKVTGLSPNKIKIYELNNSLIELEKIIRDKKSLTIKQNYNSLLKTLDQLMIDAVDNKNDIKNKIILEALSQEAIVYLDRFSTRDGYKNTMNSILDKYSKNNFRESLNEFIIAVKRYSV